MSDVQRPSGSVVLGGRYEVHRRLARGGMAEVYLARDSALDRPVAVKVLFPEFAADPSFVERFRREAQAAANLTHPNIVSVFDWGAEAGTYYIVMEYVDGQSVAQLLRNTGPMPPQRAASIAFETAGALGFAHTRGVVHRDVKPGNILVNSQGIAKVTDFGIARALSSPAEDLTQAGSVMGTATYFSPEQAQGFPVDARSDLYSLGVVLYEMLCGRPPFAGDSPVAIAYKHVQDTPARPEQVVSTVPSALGSIVMKLLAKDPAERYVSAEDLRADLRRWLDGQPTAAEAGELAATTVQPALTPTPSSATTVANPALGAQPQQAMSHPPTPPSEAAAITPPAPAPRSNRAFMVISTVIVLALAGLGIWLYLSLDDDTASNVAVPALIGSNVEEAKQKLADAGFTYTIQEGASDSPVGVVYDQDPKALTIASTAKPVTVFVSIGRAKLVVPSVKDKSAADAQAALEAAPYNFKVSIKQVADETVAVGLAIDTDPAQGSEVENGAAIQLRVSSGPDAIEIPSVTGKSIADATKALKAKGFSVAAEEQREASDTVAKDKVIRTEPSGSASKTTPIVLVVSSGPEQVKVPSVKGMTEAEARQTLTNAKLQVDVTFSKSLDPGDPEIGRVLSSDPAAGTSVDPGTTVKITIGAVTNTTTTASSTSTTSTTSP